MPLGRIKNILSNIRNLRPLSIPHRDEEVVVELPIDELPPEETPPEPPTVNIPPVIVSFSGESYDTIVGETLSFTVVAYDPDGSNRDITYHFTSEAGTYDNEVVGITVDGNSQSVIEWTAPVTIPVQSSVTYRINVEATDEDGGTTVHDPPLVITVRRVCEVPDKPADEPIVTNDGVDVPTMELDVMWTDPADNGCSIIDYDLRYHNGDGNWLSWMGSEMTWLPFSPDTDGYITTINNLDPGTEYHIQVRAENSSGNGEWSNSGLGSTAPVNQPPTVIVTANPTVIARSGSNNLAMQSTITATASDPEGEDLTYVFTVLDKDDIDIGDMGIRNTQPPSDNIRIFSPPSSDDNTDYRIRCTVSDMQTPPNSALDTAPVRVIAVPDKPAVPVVTSPVAQTVSVTWVEPNDNNSEITDYDIRRKQSSLDETAWEIVTGLDDFTDLTTMVGSIDETEIYDFQVRAENEAGESEWSDTASSAPPGVSNQCPIISSFLANFSIPGDVSADRGGQVFLTLVASDPDNDPISYSFEVISVDGNPPPTMDQGWQFTAAPFGLLNEHLFTPSEPGVYVVRGSVSDDDTNCNVFQDKTITVENDPPDVTIEIIENMLRVGGSTDINAIVTDPNNDPTMVLWEVIDSNDAVITDGSGGTFSNPTDRMGRYLAPTMNSQAGTYTIRATARDIPYGAPAMATVDVEITILILPPEKVPIASVDRMPANHTELNVMWNEPLDDGGSPITEYEVGYRLTQDMDMIDIVIPIGGTRRLASELEAWFVTGRENHLVTTLTTYPIIEDIDNLDEGAQYDFRVRAKNGVHADYGEWSDVITQETSTTLTVRLTARSTTINKGTTTLLTAIASRADNIEYVFTAPNGGTFTTFAPFLSNQRNWVAPDKSTLYQEQNGVPDAYEIIVVANDTTTSELPVRDSIQITVLNRAPVIDLFESPGLSFDISTLTPNVVTGNSELPFTIRVTDPDLVDADNLAIEWSTNGGSHVVQDAGLSCLWTLPALPATAVEYDITVTVKDGDYITDSSNNVVEAEDSKTAIIRVNAVPTVTVTASDTRVGAQDQVTITAVIDDPDDTIDDNEVYWDPSNGNFIGDQTVVSNGTYTRVWESPNANGTSTIIVEYRDIYRSPNFDIASGFVQIVVTDNSPPQLRILGDDTVATNQVLRLQAAPVEGMSTIDPDGDTLTFVWEIVSGPGRLETTDNNVLHDPRLPYDPPINPVVTEDTAIIYIPPSPPSRPDAPTVEEVVGEITSLQVTWVAPDNNGTDITDYDIRYKITGQDEDQYVGESFIGTGVTHKIENLNSQTSYDVQVRATNLAGPSDWSETGVGMTPNAPPVITSFTATPPIASINREVTLMVNATDADAKPSDLNYLFEIVNDPEDNSFGFLIDVFPSNVNIYTAPGTVGSYDVMVTVSDNADPPASVSRTLTIPVVDVPSTITTIRVRQGTTDTTIPIPRSVLDVTWTAPDDNGSTIIGYDIEYRESGLSIANTMRLTATSATLERLEPDTDYEVRVRAQNSAGVNLGNGEWSGYVTGHTADDIPDIPVITIVVPPDTTSGRLQVSWTVADDNGSAITDYNIQYRVSVPPGDPVNPWDEWRMGETITTSPEIVAGLVDTDPTTYDIQVQATNGVGTTEWSEIAVGTTRDPNQPPTIVRFTADETEIVASDVVQTTIPRFSVLTVIANDDNTARDDLIYTFTIIGDTATDDRGSFRAHPQNIHQIIYDPPKDAGVYTVSVEVSDEDIGYIQPTRSLDITVLNVPDAPPAPRLMPSTTDFREMTVTWDEPFNNFSLITDYDVQYKTSEDSDLDYTILMRSETSITRSETLAMLTPGTTYNIQVRAVNAVGEGDWSDVATDMTGRTPLRLISVTANPMTIMVGETSTITVLAEGHNLMYEYSVAEGEGTRMNAVVTNQQIYTAPDTAGTYTITVVVTDGVSFVTGMETITVTAAATVPDVILRPQVFGISNLNQNSVVFRWLEPYDGGSPITGYQVERNGSLISGIQPTTRSFTGNSVDRVRIRAVNSVGVGSFSTSFTGRSKFIIRSSIVYQSDVKT